MECSVPSLNDGEWWRDGTINTHIHHCRSCTALRRPTSQYAPVAVKAVMCFKTHVQPSVGSDGVSESRI